eukprot:gene5828-4155_t
MNIEQVHSGSKCFCFFFFFCDTFLAVYLVTSFAQEDVLVPLDLQQCEVIGAAKVGPRETLERDATPTEKKKPLPTKVEDLHGERIRGELERQRSLQKKIRDAEEEVQIMTEELKRCGRTQTLREFKPFPTAKAYMSTTEMIQEGSPQFLDVTETPPQVAKQSEGGGEPAASDMGGGAVVSLVGRIASSPKNSAPIVPGLQGGRDPWTEFLVHYSLPTMEKLPCGDDENAPSARVCIRCFGETLREFSLRSLRKGDVVHVLGQLLPPNKQDATNVIGVLPLGGNISVVVPTE